MPGNASYDSVAKLLAKQFLGGTADDMVQLALTAMDLSLGELQQRHRLISQETSHSFTSTGANSYTFTGTPISKENVFRLAKIWTADGPLDVLYKPEFIETHQSYLDNTVGLPAVAVLWGDDSLYIWPDQSGSVIYFDYYSLIDATKVDAVLWALRDIAAKVLDPSPDSRMSNYKIAEAALGQASRANQRGDASLRFLPERRVGIFNSWKRGRR